MNSNVKPRKHLGQHFLNDPKILKEIISFSRLKNHENIIEIGPGPGSFTSLLLEAGHNVTAVEIDKRFCLMLREKFGHFKNFHLIEDDATRVDFHKVAHSTHLTPPIVLMGNFPYNVGTNIIKRGLLLNNLFSSISGILQEEVVRRIVALPSQKSYSFLSVYCQYFSEIKMGKILKKGSFTPPPKVRSAIFRMNFYKERPLDEKEEKTFLRLISTAFAHRRKTLINNLLSFEIKDELISNWLTQKGHTLKVRAEDLTTGEFMELTRLIHPYVG